MNDVRMKAEERAANPSQRPVGTSFETERQREKAALAMQINQLDGSRVKKISATAEREQHSDKQLRVAAYCRVSTDDIDQAISIGLQMKTYKEMIRENPNWKYAGTYVDDGFSGTNTQHRPGFLKLIEDVRAGKIDMIITKAVSRFARNLLDCIGYIEELKNMDPPVRVFFEQEKLDTGLQTSGIILFVLAMVAEEESHMKSEAMLLSLEWRFSRGRFLTPKLYGYDKIEIPDGYGGTRKILKINEQQANVVRWIYSKVLNGADNDEIADALTELNIPTPGTYSGGKQSTKWNTGNLYSLLRNERYCGDVLARKTYTPNFKDHKSKKNKGKKNRYFQPDHHEAIVSRTVWNAVQRILNSRKYHCQKNGNYIPISIIESGILTGFISLNKAWAGFDYNDYIRASQIVMGLLDEELTYDLETEYIPDGGRKIGTLIDDHGISQIARDLTEAEQQIKDELEGLDRTKSDIKEQKETAKTFQVVDGSMFKRGYMPSLTIFKNKLIFNSHCIKKLDAEYIEFLFNPVEHVVVIRPCDESHPNAIKWPKRNQCFSSKVIVKNIFDCMDWDKDYNYKIFCRTLNIEGKSFLLFDLDDYVGTAINQKNEVIVPEQTVKIERGEGKSYYYPPDDDEEVQEVTDIAEQVEEAIELKKKMFGTPVAEHEASPRKIEAKGKLEEWLIPATPLDSSHVVDQEIVSQLWSDIQNNPPVMPERKLRFDDFMDNGTVIVDKEEN